MYVVPNEKQKYFHWRRIQLTWRIKSFFTLPISYILRMWPHRFFVKKREIDILESTLRSIRGYLINMKFTRNSRFYFWKVMSALGALPIKSTSWKQTFVRYMYCLICKKTNKQKQMRWKNLPSTRDSFLPAMKGINYQVMISNHDCNSQTIIINPVDHEKKTMPVLCEIPYYKFTFQVSEVFLLER